MTLTTRETRVMTDKPILFNGDMVRAILREIPNKTQTRRIVKMQPVGAWAAPGKTACPYGQPGDRLLVREPWRVAECYDGKSGSDLAGILSARNVYYEADLDKPLSALGRYRHGRFMPRWASRITLEITHVRAERLQEITEDDAIAEGVSGAIRGDKVNISSGNTVVRVSEPILDFAALWDSINAPRGFGWDANPWVWVITFKRLTP